MRLSAEEHHANRRESWKKLEAVFVFKHNMLGRGGATGIRTLETVSRLHTFQACAFDHSATAPLRGVYDAGAVVASGPRDRAGPLPGRVRFAVCRIARRDA